MKKLLFWASAMLLVSALASCEPQTPQEPGNPAQPETPIQPEGPETPDKPSMPEDPTVTNFTETVKGISLEMIAVEGGTFQMGATEEQGDDAWNDEYPVHDVTLSSFHLSKTEVTQALYQAVMGENPSESKGDNLPVDNVSRDDAKKFCEKLSQLTGKIYVLPTEAQWEYAARGGKYDEGTKYAGSNNLEEVAWYEANSNNKPHPVATKAPNALGLYDMSGNVYEFCADGFYHYSVEPEINPMHKSWVPLIRGGYYNQTGEFARVSWRGDFPPGSGGGIGFRVAMIDYLRQVPDLEMIFVEGGTFQMGATEEQGSDAFDDEYPVHTVTLSDYYLSKTEITQAQYQAVMGNNPSRFNYKGGNYPVEQVSWDDAKSFCEKLSRLTGKNFVLPTEAQWEYAARGGKYHENTKYAGSNNIDEVAWYGEAHEKGSTHPVATKAPNALGLYDMSGNVDEWCADRYGPYSEQAQTNPTGPTQQEDHDNRVLRGGSWNAGYDASGCGARCSRVSFRTRNFSSFDYLDIGFRIAMIP